MAELSHATARLTDVLISADDEFMVTSSVDGVFQWRKVDFEEEEVVRTLAISTAHTHTTFAGGALIAAASTAAAIRLAEPAHDTSSLRHTRTHSAGL